MSNYGGWPGQPGPGAWVYTPPAPKPGVIPLHPLSLAEVLAGIFGTIRHYFKALYAPMAVVMLASGVILTAMLALCYSPLHNVYVDIQNHNHATGVQITELFSLLGGFYLVCLIISLGCYVATGLISTTVLRHAVIGRKVTVRQVLSEAAPRLWQLIGGLVLLALAGFGPLVVASAVTLALLALAGPVAALGLLLLMMPAGVWSAYVPVRLALLAPVIVLENAKPKDAFSRAWRLNQSHWWRTFGFTLLVAVIGSCATQIVNTPVSLMTSGSVLNSFSQPDQSWTVSDLPSFGSFWIYLVGLVVTSLVSILLAMPLIPLCNGLLYIDRRIRRESLDEQLAEEAGVSLTRPPVPPQAPGGWPGQPPYGQQPWQQPYGGQQYGQPQFGQPPHGQSPYGGWPGQQPQPRPVWPGAQPPAPPVPPAPTATPAPAPETPGQESDETPPPSDATPSA